MANPYRSGDVADLTGTRLSFATKGSKRGGMKVEPVEDEP
jgi:hypothetical protein